MAQQSGPLEPFTIALPEAELADLRARLTATRWPDDSGNDDGYYGVNVAYLRDLVDYWLTGFDWRAIEARLNAHDQYRVAIDGVPVHFLRAAGRGPAPIPLILTHGWPWTFWDWHKLIGPLTDPAAHGGDPADAFELIIPSFPGFGFSTPVPPDMNFWKAADLLHVVMTQVLGFERFAAGGSDMGSFVTGQLGHKYGADLIGLFLARPLPLDAFQTERPWDVTGGRMVPDGAAPAFAGQMIAYQRRFASHVAVHMLDSETQAFGLTDSPVALLAWLVARWRGWSDCGGDVERVWSRDDMLTNVMIYWMTRSIRSSMRAYANIHRYPWRPSHDRVPQIEPPMGAVLLGYENPPGVTTATRAAAFRASPEARWFDVRHVAAHERGGHFAAYENPDAVIAGIRDSFRPLR